VIARLIVRIEIIHINAIWLILTFTAQTARVKPQICPEYACWWLTSANRYALSVGSFFQKISKKWLSATHPVVNIPPDRHWMAQR
jgi:hypothetical protein